MRSNTYTDGSYDAPRQPGGARGPGTGSSQRRRSATPVPSIGRRPRRSAGSPAARPGFDPYEQDPQASENHAPLAGGVLLDLSDDLVELIAERAAAIVADRQANASAGSPWLNAAEAAEHLRCPRGRIYDLIQLRKLHPRYDGRRVLLAREELDRYLERGL